MAKTKLRKVVQSVVRVEVTPEGTRETTRIYRRKRSKRAKELRPLEKIVLKLVKEQQKATRDYLRRHQRSNSGERDGWAQDYAENLVKSHKDLDNAWVKHVVLNRPL